MYYPKSQIKTNLYTNGNQYILSTTKEPYIGPYYEISSGDKYTGKNPQDGPNILLSSPPQDFNIPSLGVITSDNPQIPLNIQIYPEDNYPLKIGRAHV